MQYPTKHHFLTTIALLTVLLVTTAVVASEEAEKGFPDQTGFNKVLIIPGSAFTNDGLLEANSYYFLFSGGYMYGNNTSNYGCVMAPAHLPEIESDVYQVYASVYDNDPTYNANVTLRRMDPYTGVVQTMAYATSSGESTSVQSIFDADPDWTDIEFPDYQYWVTTCMQSAAIRMYSVRVWYHNYILFTDYFESGNTSAWDLAVP